MKKTKMGAIVVEVNSRLITLKVDIINSTDFIKKYLSNYKKNIYKLKKVMYYCEYLLKKEFNYD